MQTDLKDQLKHIQKLMLDASGEEYAILNDIASSIAALRYQVAALTNQNDKIDWLKKATRFDLGLSKKYLYHHGVGRPVVIETRGQMDGSTKWIVFMDGFCLGSDGAYHYEKMPSSRTDNFIKKTRFNSKEEAYEMFLKSENSSKYKTLKMR